MGMSIGHEGVAFVAVHHLAMTICPSPVGASWIGRWPYRRYCCQAPHPVGTSVGHEGVALVAVRQVAAALVSEPHGGVHRTQGPRALDQVQCCALVPAADSLKGHP